MITKAKILSLLLATTMVSSPLMVYADSGDMQAPPPADASQQPGDWDQGQHENMMAKILNLTDDQIKQLKDDHEKQKEAMKGLMEQIKANREAFDAEIIKTTPDMNKINGLQTEIKALDAQRVDNHLNGLLDIKKILTPEQFAGFMALKKEHELKKEREIRMSHNHKGGFGKDGCDHKNWSDKADQGDNGPMAEDQD